MRVLIAVDIHRQGKQLVNAAVQWLEGRSDIESIDLVYAFELTPGGNAPWPEPYIWNELMPQWEKLYGKARDDLQTLLAAVPESKRGLGLCPVGAASRSVSVMTHRYDMVIVGTHQVKGLARIWLGSHAERLVRNSDAPVVVLPLVAE